MTIAVIFFNIQHIYQLINNLSLAYLYHISNSSRSSNTVRYQVCASAHSASLTGSSVYDV